MIESLGARRICAGWVSHLIQMYNDLGLDFAMIAAYLCDTNRLKFMISDTVVKIIGPISCER